MFRIPLIGLEEVYRDKPIVKWHLARLAKSRDAYRQEKLKEFGELVYKLRKPLDLIEQEQ